MCKEPHTFKRLIMETVPRQVHQDGHWMTMGLGIKWLNTIKGEPKTLTGKMSPQELCKLASGCRRGTWSFCQLQSFLRSAQKVRDLICRRKGEFEDIARADHVLYKREIKTYNPPMGKMDIQGHPRGLLHLLFWASSANHRILLLIQCGCLSIPCWLWENTLAYQVYISEHLLLSTGEHPGLSSVDVWTSPAVHRRTPWHLLLTNKATPPNPSQVGPLPDD